MGYHRLEADYHSQLNNAYNPMGSCNVTSMAIAADYLGVKPSNGGQLEDEFYLYMENNGLDRHRPDHLVALAQAYGLKDSFYADATIGEIQSWLDADHPVVVHGWFTESGHIIAIIGYDDEAYNGRGAFICHDPYGEWTSEGYIEGGANVLYSYGLITRLCDDGGIWAHNISR